MNTRQRGVALLMVLLILALMMVLASAMKIGRAHV